MSSSRNLTTSGMLLPAALDAKYTELAGGSSAWGVAVEDSDTNERSCRGHEIVAKTNSTGLTYEK